MVQDGIHASLRPLAVAIGDVRPHPKNPRLGDVSAIRDSLLSQGQYRPIVVNRDGYILAGNHAWRAAVELGWREIAATYVDVDEQRAERILLVDNRTSDLASYDPEMLLALLEDLTDLEGTGYDHGALAELVAEVRPVELPGIEEEVPPAPAEPRTRPGDRYRLGRHLLVCGDATDSMAY